MLNARIFPMVKKLMVVFFGVFAVLIVLAVTLLSGKMLLLRSPDGKTVYELRLHDGKFQHALRHGGAQLFSWSDFELRDENGNAVLPTRLSVERSNPKTGEFEIVGFPDDVRLLVRVTDTFVASTFFGLPAGETTEHVELRPEAGALGTRFNDASIEGLDESVAARPFIFVAPKPDGGDTFLVYHHTESADGARPRFLYDQADLDAVNFTATTIYDERVEDGLLHVLYFSDSPVLLHEIYEKGPPSEPFPTLNRSSDEPAE